MTQRQCKDCPKMIIQRNKNHLRCQGCSADNNNKRAREYATRNKDKRRRLYRRCVDCNTRFKTINAHRLLCDKCTSGNEPGKTSKIVPRNTTPLHFGSGAQMPAERVWEQMMRECR